VRKVLGASVRNILVLLSGCFLRLTLISLLIAFPISWLAMHAWLEGFAYRTSLGVVIFLKTAGIIAVVVIATISFQSVKAALVNPSKNLKGD